MPDLDGTEVLNDLRALARLGRLESALTEGMLTDQGRISRANRDGIWWSVRYPAPESHGTPWLRSTASAEVTSIDLQDPATVGCLRALWREATRDKFADCWFSHSAAAWLAMAKVRDTVESYESEVDALAEAFRALRRDLEQRIARSA